MEVEEPEQRRAIQGFGSWGLKSRVCAGCCMQAQAAATITVLTGPSALAHGRCRKRVESAREQRHAGAREEQPRGHGCAAARRRGAAQLHERKSSLGDAESSLRDAESSLRDAERVLMPTWYRNARGHRRRRRRHDGQHELQLALALVKLSLC